MQPRALAISLALGLSFVWTPSAAQARTTTVPGIDVSKWQGAIDWPSVAASGEVFAILRADKGADYVDPRYDMNLQGATTAGVIVGAYHRATPSAVPAHDAVQEADHFLATARNASGDLVPALDIEETGGLTPTELQDWVRAWVKRVRSRLGVRAMLYASPYFWRVSMGDTTWFADHGHPLWIAHWGATAPSVPANGWGGNGWTFWQWTSTGVVHGITTDVDRDRFNGTDLSMGRIASVTVTPPIGGTVSGPRIACGGGAATCRRLANPGDLVSLTASPDADARFLGWTGACAGVTVRTCDVTAVGDVSVSAMFGYPLTVERTGSGAGTVTSQPAGLGCGDACDVTFPAGASVELSAVPDSASAFGVWTGACAGAGSDPSCSVSIDGPVSVGARFDATVRLEQDGAGTSYRWGRTKDARALGGWYLWERRAGASTSFAVSGDRVTLFALEGPTMGRSAIVVDGVTLLHRDWYARHRAFVSLRLEGLGSGSHVLTVRAMGTARPASLGTRVAVDGLRWGGEVHPNPVPSVASWGSIADPTASGGTTVASDVPNAAASVRFGGTGCTLITARGPEMGIADVWIDGALIGRVDLYAPSPVVGAKRSFDGLADGPHRVTVVVTGTHRAVATGSTIVVDGWIVR